MISCSNHCVKTQLSSESHLRSHAHLQSRKSPSRPLLSCGHPVNQSHWPLPASCAAPGSLPPVGRSSRMSPAVLSLLCPGETPWELRPWSPGWAYWLGTARREPCLQGWWVLVPGWPSPKQGLLQRSQATEGRRGREWALQGSHPPSGICLYRILLVPECLGPDG